MCVNSCFLLPLSRTKVCILRAEETLKGKPVKVRNCARSCELLNGPVVYVIEGIPGQAGNDTLREGAAPGAVRRPALSSLT